MRLLYSYVVPLVLVCGACSSAGDDSSGSSPEPPASTSSPSPPSESESPSESEPSACPEVRSGIDDFNAGDFESTVEHFEAALPLAQEQDEDDGSGATADLVEAVEYYVDLPPGDYLEAAASSPDFAKYKEITLGQCYAGQGPRGTPSDEPVPA